MLYITCAPPGSPAPSDNWLYAHPRVPVSAPERGAICILDSGAYALSQRGQSITPAYMQVLAAYYRAHGSGAHCIAPDVFLDPAQTLANWRYWQETLRGPVVVPVIQFAKKGKLDLMLAHRQARSYAGHPFVAISNPGLTAAQSARQNIVELCAIVRSVSGAARLHNLGAGWSPKDVAAWRDLGCFDSIDSIAYYTDAQDGWLWRLDGKRVRSDLPQPELIALNACAAIAVAGGCSPRLN